MKYGSIMPDERSYILGARKCNGYFDPQITEVVSLDTVGDIVVQGIKKQRKNGMCFAAFNYINCIVGSGVIGIPFALRQSGFGMGLLMLLVVSFISDYSLILMLKSAHLCGVYTYQGIMEVSYGSIGFILLSVLQLIYPITAMVSYNIIVGDTMTKVLVRIFSIPVNSFLVRRDIVVGVATLFITVPLCLLKDLVPLARASLFSFVLVIGIVGTLFIRLFSLSGVVPKTEDAFQFINWDIIPAFGIMAFAFMCHHNVFLLYDSIENANQAKWNKITHWSVILSLIILSIFGILGYATFTGYTEGDLLENYCWNDDLINVSRFAFAFTVLFAFPIECMTARSVIGQLININGDNTSCVQHVLITLLIVVLTYLISVTTNCLGFVLEMNGIFSAIPLAFVLPALCYLKLEEGALTSKRKLPALGLAIFGLICSVLGCVLIYLKIGESGKCNRKSELSYCIHQQ